MPDDEYAIGFELAQHGQVHAYPCGSAGFGVAPGGTAQLGSSGSVLRYTSGPACIGLCSFGCQRVQLAGRSNDNPFAESATSGGDCD